MNITSNPEAGIDLARKVEARQDEIAMDDRYTPNEMNPALMGEDDPRAGYDVLPRPGLMGYGLRRAATPIRTEHKLTGCPWHDVKEMLQSVGLRPTRQRMALGWLLFGKGGRHLTAEMLFEEANQAKVPVSLATVYNTLNQLTDLGLLRQVSVDGSKTYFDTNITSHHHFYLEGTHELLDIEDPAPLFQRMPDVPKGYEISRIDLVVRLRKVR